MSNFRERVDPKKSRDPFFRLVVRVMALSQSA
jgi:hypothetical protein